MSLAQRAVRAQVERLCASALDERTMRSSVLAALRRTIDFDSHVWLLTDPVTAVGCSPLADVPCLQQLPLLIKLKYGTAVNRWTVLLGDGGPAGLLCAGTGGRPESSAVWRGLLRHLGVGDVASVVFADRYGCWGFLDLWRIGGRPFTAADALLLEQIAAPVATGLRRRQATAFTVPPTTTAPIGGPAVLVLDDDLQITDRTTAAGDWLRSLLPTPIDQAPIPAAAYNVAAQLIAREQNVDPHPAISRTWVPGRTWVTLRASRLESDSRIAGSGSIVVSIEETPAGPRLDLFSRSNGLSSRERQVLALISSGSETGEVAGAMAIAENTVQDHLKSIFGKTGITGRGALVSAAIGPRPALA
jgi:DNA-binding CsgD family transcriptional regulator